ncbi:MAG: SUMF1/EgtB/PvdO family nonheme iron enzyme [Prosthecobacter sp.]|uniref:formylglycine-generating enzyme family protein n=1 Tax=Prosthecobacter sp. TaxID=1965333 RepID=UPI003BAF8690
MKIAPLIRVALAIFGLLTASSLSQAVEQAPAEAVLLLTQYESKVRADVMKPHELAITDLNAKFVQALEREQDAAQKGGKLEEALAFKAEREAVLAGRYTGEASGGAGPLSMQKMRSTYRLAMLRLEQDRDSKLRPLLAMATTSFQGLVETLTKSGKLDEAVATKNMLQALLTTPVTPLPAVHGAKPVGLFTNSLGMVFVPVPGTDILMCIHETRNADYAAYAASTPGVNEMWKKMAAQMFSREDDDRPVTGVSYEEAVAFCLWLSKKKGGHTYRLPTDREWSIAVGLDKKENWTKTTTPESLNERVPDEFPWGGIFPPQTADRIGNYADVTLNAKMADKSPIDGNFSDGHPYTAPVMSFKPNSLGIYDLGGNVWEWVDDWFNEAKQQRTLRGAAWNINSRQRILSSARDSRRPHDQGNNHGFRVVTVATP